MVKKSKPPKGGHSKQHDSEADSAFLNQVSRFFSSNPHSSTIYPAWHVFETNKEKTFAVQMEEVLQTETMDRKKMKGVRIHFISVRHTDIHWTPMIMVIKKHHPRFFILEPTKNYDHLHLLEPFIAKISKFGAHTYLCNASMQKDGHSCATFTIHFLSLLASCNSVSSKGDNNKSSEVYALSLMTCFNIYRGKRIDTAYETNASASSVSHKLIKDGALTTVPATLLSPDFFLLCQNKAVLKTYLSSSENSNARLQAILDALEKVGGKNEESDRLREEYNKHP